MSLPTTIEATLSLPVMSSPMFLVSGTALVVEQCVNGIIGSFPALNARGDNALEEWICEIKHRLNQYRGEHPDARVAPFAVNLVLHESNPRLDEDFNVCVRNEVPLIITSLASRNALSLAEVVRQVHGYGGHVFHDVTTVRHARKALESGVDGLILVCNGAGGHAGTLSPFALVSEVREFFDGPLVLGGCISSGEAILAAQVLGCDLAYIGTHFIATDESLAQEKFKDLVVKAKADDIVYSALFSGVHGNFLKESIRAIGMDPDNLPPPSGSREGLSNREKRPKPWRDVWSAGQGVGNAREVVPARQSIARLKSEYAESLEKAKLRATRWDPRN